MCNARYRSKTNYDNLLSILIRQPDDVKAASDLSGDELENLTPNIDLYDFSHNSRIAPDRDRNDPRRNRYKP